MEMSGPGCVAIKFIYRNRWWAGFGPWPTAGLDNQQNNKSKPDLSYLPISVV